MLLKGEEEGITVLGGGHLPQTYKDFQKSGDPGAI